MDKQRQRILSYLSFWFASGLDQIKQCPPTSGETLTYSVHKFILTDRAETIFTQTLVLPKLRLLNTQHHLTGSPQDQPSFAWSSFTVSASSGPEPRQKTLQYTECLLKLINHAKDQCL